MIILNNGCLFNILKIKMTLNSTTLGFLVLLLLHLRLVIGFDIQKLFIRRELMLVSSSASLFLSCSVISTFKSRGMDLVSWAQLLQPLGCERGLVRRAQSNLVLLLSLDRLSMSYLLLELVLVGLYS